MMLKNCLVLLFAGAAACASLAETQIERRAREICRPAAQMTVERAFQKDGACLLYRWHAPRAIVPGRVYPLVVLFHGAGESGDDNLAQLVHGADDILSYAKKTGEELFFIAGQVPRGQRWVDTPWELTSHTMPEQPTVSMKLVLALIEQTKRDFPIDPSRIYATGISMGGYGTWDAVQRRPDLFAAAIPICGGGDVACAERIKEVPIWCFHGDQDTAVPTCRSRDMFNAIKAVKGNVQYREYVGVGHNSWTATYRDEAVLKWFFAQRKGPAAEPPKPSEPRETVIFVATHSDDSEGFAATAKLLSRTYDVHLVDICHGDYELGEKGVKDDPRMPPRMKEELSACAYAGFTPHFLSEPDADAHATRKSVEQFTAILKKVKPRAVFTHWPLDRHADHVQCAAIVARALVKAGRAPSPGQKFDKSMCERYYFEVNVGQTKHFHPTYSVDVTETIHDKLGMLRRYVKQNTGDHIAKNNEERARRRGAERSPKCAYAELFSTFDGKPIPGGVLDKLPQAVLSLPGEGDRDMPY